MNQLGYYQEHLISMMSKMSDLKYEVSCIEDREGNGKPLQYFCLENPTDRGAWWAAVHRVTQSRTRLKQLSMHACVGEGNGNPLQCSCLENPRDGGVWRAAVYGVAESDTTEVTQQQQQL